MTKKVFSSCLMLIIRFYLCYIAYLILIPMLSIIFPSTGEISSSLRLVPFEPSEFLLQAYPYSLYGMLLFGFMGRLSGVILLSLSAFLTYINIAQSLPEFFLGDHHLSFLWIVMSCFLILEGAGGFSFDKIFNSLFINKGDP